MTVSELIAQLYKLDPNDTVMEYDRDYRVVRPIEFCGYTAYKIMVYSKEEPELQPQIGRAHV